MKKEDPQPAVPREPLPEECCGLGCDPCVFDRYAEDLTKYRLELDAWQRRNSASSRRAPKRRG